MKNQEIIFLCGNAPNQRALANKIAKNFNLKAIVIETNISKKKMKIRQLLNKIAGRIFLNKLYKAWENMMSTYQAKYPDWPSCEILKINDINSEEVIRFCEQQNSSLFMVSGTRLIKKGLLQLQPDYGIINLHTGLSPYVKGGPNCTNWCLSNKNYHLIGNTVMWLDEGIDTGNLIKTDFVNFDGKEALMDIHWKVMEDAHKLYMKSVQSIFSNKLSKPGIVQTSIAKGTTYYNKMWGFKEQYSVIKNLPDFRNSIISGEIETHRKNIIIVNSD